MTQGLAAASINIGAMEDSSYVAENSAILESMRASGYCTIRETELLDFLRLAVLQRNRPTVISGTESYAIKGQFSTGLRFTKAMSDASNRVPWRRDRRAAIYHNHCHSRNDTVSSTTNPKLTDFLRVCAADPQSLQGASTANFLARQITLKLFDLIIHPLDDEAQIDTSLSLQDLGLDSLVAVELRTWWKQTFGFEIRVLEMLDMGSVLSLGAHAALGPLEKYESSSGEGSGRAQAVPATKMP